MNSSKIITDLEGHAKVFDFTSRGQQVKCSCDQKHNSTNGEWIKGVKSGQRDRGNAGDLNNS